MGQIAKLGKFFRAAGAAWFFLIAIALVLTSGLVFAEAPRHPDYREIHGLSKAEACAEAQKTVAAGDVLLTEINNYVFRNIARMTNSWTSHVGLVYRAEDGEWMVWESTMPRSKRSRLCDFLSRTNGSRFAIRRLNRELSASEFAALARSAEARLDIAYDTGFNYDSNKQFCSKFVYQVFLEATGLEIGKRETFQDLRDANPDVDLAFAEAWFFGGIPWERVTVTPASQYIDDDLATVLESFN